MENIIETVDLNTELEKINKVQSELEARKTEVENQQKYTRVLIKQKQYVESVEGKYNHRNKCMDAAFNILLECGCKNIKLLEEIKTLDTPYEFQNIKEEHKIDIKVDVKSIQTEYGTITTINSDLTCHMPYRIHSQIRNYKIKTIAKKILEEDKAILANKKRQNELEESKQFLIKMFRESSPQETKIFTKTSWERSKYSRNGGYDINLIRLEYPNGSWVEIEYTSKTNWNIRNKFDSKYIKPETREGWLSYLQK